MTIPYTAFELPLEMVFLGVVTGLTYALFGIGLTLIYKTSRVINFAHGAMAVLPASLFLLLTLQLGVPYLVALVTVLIAGALVGGLTEFLVVRRLSQAPRLVVLVATIGVSQVLTVFGLLIPREDFGGTQFPTPFTATLRVGDLRVHSGEILILLAVPVITGALTMWLRGSKTGLASRAAADNPEASLLAGVPTRRVSMTIWVIAALIATMSAILIGPTQPIGQVVDLGPDLMVRALAAAMLGSLSSLPQVFVGGIAIGVVERLVQWNYPTGGAVELVLFTVIVTSLLLRRRLGRVARGGEDSGWSLGGAVSALPKHLASNAKVQRARRAAFIGLVVLAIVLPIPLDSASRVLLSSVLLFALMGLSLVVLTGLAGQVSLGQFAFVGIGAVVGGRLFQLGYPTWVALLYTLGAGGLAALVVGLPALRLRGLFLAVSTLAFAVASGSWLLTQDWLVVVVNDQTSMRLPRQQWLGIDLADELHYVWLSLALLIVGAALVHRLRRTGIGRMMMAVRDNEPAAAAMSVSARRVKLLAFMISGMLASLAGYFYGGLLVNFTDTSLFAPEWSLHLVTTAILGGITTITGALLGAAWMRGIPTLLGSEFGLLSSGLGVIVVLQMMPGGLAQLAFRIRDRVAAWIAQQPVSVLEPSERETRQRREPLPASNGRIGPARQEGAPRPLEAHHVAVRYGGLTAVDGVSLHAREGEIVGLVGPNGAGKTTLFDVLSGQIAPSSGRVTLYGRDVTRLRADRRARRGLGRSFQEARLYPDLTLHEAFRVALERHDPSEALPSLLGLPPSRRSERWKQLRTDELLSLLGLEPFANRNCSELSTGTRRFAELGCLIGMGCRVLLLDEPTAGIAQREVEAFTPVLREVRDHLDATIVVIDHDMPMIMGLVDRLYVMSAGQVIAEGDPQQLRHDPRVVSAYLGTDESVVARSGVRA